MNDFTKYLQSKGLSEATQKAYVFNTTRYLQWYAKEIENTTKKDILAYLEYLKTHKHQANITRNHNLYALQHYFDFLCKEDRIFSNPTALIKIRGVVTQRIPNTFTEEQLDQLYDDYYHKYIHLFDGSHIPQNQQERNYLSRQRNYVMLGFLIYQGLVTRDMDFIEIDDLDLQRGKVTIKRNSKQRVLPLATPQIGALMYYLQNIRPRLVSYCSSSHQLFLPLPPSGKSFTHTHSLMGVYKPLTKQVRTLHGNFKKLQQLRASRIVCWIKTKGLRKAQYLAGHKSISSTEAYQCNDIEQLTNNISQFHPL